METVATAVAEGKLPGRVWIYSNTHCNLSCNYCMTESSPRAKRRAMSQERMVTIGREAKELGFTALGVTGGEPFLLPWLIPTLLELSDLLPVVVLTNGTLFNKKLLAATAVLADRDLKVQISLDRPDPVRNDISRSTGNFHAVTSAVRELTASGVTVRIASTMARDRAEELPRLKQLVQDLGVLPEDHIIRPMVQRGRAHERGVGTPVGEGDLSGELTITAEGAFWSAFGPSVRGGRTDTDLLLCRTTQPLNLAASTLLSLHGSMPRGHDAQLGIR